MALDQLLSLGPGNIEALKLKCFLYSLEGKFREEFMAWEKVLDQDYEDPDARYFFRRRDMEEREGFYFTDSLSRGGRRFLAHPRSLINASLGGLLGCTIFLLVSGYARSYIMLASPLVSFSSFFLCVILPWFFILLSWIRGLREVLITSEGVVFNARVKSYSLAWQNTESAFLAHLYTEGKQKLSLILIPSDPGGEVFELDLSRDSSTIRARSLFIDEVCRCFGRPICVRRHDLHLPSDRLIRF